MAGAGSRHVAQPDIASKVIVTAFTAGLLAFSKESPSLWLLQPVEGQRGQRKVVLSAGCSHSPIMLGRLVAGLLTVLVVILGTTYGAAPMSAGMDCENEPAIMDGMQGACGGCDHQQLPAAMRCQVGCMGPAAAFLTVPVLPIPTPTTGWMLPGDVHKSGRKLAPDLPPPKRSGLA